MLDESALVVQYQVGESWPKVFHSPIHRPPAHTAKALEIAAKYTDEISATYFDPPSNFSAPACGFPISAGLLCIGAMWRQSWELGWRWRTHRDVEFGECINRLLCPHCRRELFLPWALLGERFEYRQCVHAECGEVFRARPIVPADCNPWAYLQAFEAGDVIARRSRQ
jgi:hypothetical protein